MNVSYSQPLLCILLQDLFHIIDTADSELIYEITLISNSHALQLRHRLLWQGYVALKLGPCGYLHTTWCDPNASSAWVMRTRGEHHASVLVRQSRAASNACMPPTDLMSDPVPTLGPQVTRVGMASFVPSLLSLMLRMLIIDAWVHGEESIDIDRQTHTAG